MRLTQKIKSAINILKDAEKEGEKCEHNYIHFNRSKYFVFKNNLYKTQKYSKPAGTIKNGRIILKGHKSIETLKSVQRGIRKIKSNRKSTFSLPESPMPERTPFSQPESEPFFKNENEPVPQTEIEPFSQPESEPFGFSKTESEPEPVEEPVKKTEPVEESVEEPEEPVKKTELLEESEEPVEQVEKTEKFEEPVESVEEQVEPDSFNPEKKNSNKSFPINSRKNQNKMNGLPINSRKNQNKMNGSTMNKMT